jgi:hypothetical protein
MKSAFSSKEYQLDGRNVVLLEPYHLWNSGLQRSYAAGTVIPVDDRVRAYLTGFADDGQAMFFFQGDEGRDWALV